jgi:ABC-type branched-subunit amino acid transport system substrate-binding protein
VALMVGRRRSWRIVIVFVALVVLAACGARVSDEQRAAAVGTGDAGGASGPVSENGSGTESGDLAPGAGDTGDAGTATSVADDSGGPTTTAFSGDNGGATDVGITGDTITVGNVATLSGPVPGLFQGAVIGTQAWVAYQNSVGGIAGRKIKLEIRDDQFDTGQNRAATRELIPKVFAFIGSFSLYDDAAVKDLEAANVPSMQVPLTPALQNSPINFAVNPVKRGAPTGPWNALKAKFPDAIAHTGGLYGDVPAAKNNFLDVQHASETVGYKWVYTRGYQPTETDFTADIVRMRQAGVKFFFTSGDVKSIARMAKAMEQQGFHPDVFLTYTAYDPTLLPLAGSAAEGIMVNSAIAMYLGEDAQAIPEIALMNQWLQKVKPGYKPDSFATYGWTEGRLFAKAMEAVGPKPTRLGVLAALRKIDSWDAYGMMANAGPASKRPPVCFIFIRVNGGKFERWESPPPKFRCENSQFIFNQ